MKKQFVPFIIILFLTGCASTPTQYWVAQSFKKAECSIPEKLAVTASLDKYEILISITNTTRELWLLDVNSSEMRLPSIGWKSGLVDNHEGNPNVPKTALLPGTSNLKLYPGSMITETDEEMDDVHWRPWPIKEDQNIEIALVFINPDGVSKMCIQEAEFKSYKKP
jgi:hypothetical protein